MTDILLGSNLVLVGLYLSLLWGWLRWHGVPEQNIVEREVLALGTLTAISIVVWVAYGVVSLLVTVLL